MPGIAISRLPLEVAIIGNGGKPTPCFSVPPALMSIRHAQTDEHAYCFFRRLCSASAIPASPEPTSRSEVGSGTTEALPVRLALTPRIIPVSDITKSPVP